MLNFLKKLFGRPEPVAQTHFTPEEFERDSELKTAGLEKVLGKMHGMVGHAIIPFAVGGAVDMYYFPNHIKGTGFATMELLESDGSEPIPNRLGTYELVAFTKYPLTSDDIGAKTPYNLIERKICGIFTMVGFFSKQAELNPNETCELPNGEGQENTCIILDSYEPDGKKFMIGNREHHLLLCIQIFRSEMEYARANGSAALFSKLKAAGNYPYSDLDRESVID